VRAPLNYPGMVALVLAGGVSASLVIAVVGGLIHPTLLTEARAQLINTVFGTVLGAVATYLGTRANSRPDPDERSHSGL